MSAEPADYVGFVHPRRIAQTRGRRAVFVVEMIATVTLVISIVVSASVVSIAMGRACATPAAVSAR